MKLHKDLFWLHIKKSAGQTTRHLLQPHYKTVDRNKMPECFIQVSPDKYNDVLNNYRVALGGYQFKRALFAKKYLYPNDWGSLYSFAFSREPIDRCVSMFHYLCWKNGKIRPIFLPKKQITFKDNSVNNRSEYAFDKFLELTLQARESKSIYSPVNNHFTTHTAPMWGDVIDEKEELLLTDIYRLENLEHGINRAFEACGYETRLNNINYRVNSSSENIPRYNPSLQQIGKIERIYHRDFDLYQNAQ